MLIADTIVVVVAIAALVAFILERRRRIAAQHTLRSVGRAVGSDATDMALVGDVREHTRLREQAEEQANSYAAALQGASIGIAMLSKGGSIRYANPAADLMLDGPGERAVLRTRVTSLGQRVNASGHPEVLEISIHDPDRKVLSLTAVPLATESSLGSVCLYIEDLSAQRRVDAMRTDFVTNAGHELKTPLGALSLLAEALADARDDESRARLAHRLQMEATRMANVIDDVLQLAETGSLGAEYTHESVVDIIDEAAKSVETLAADRGIPVERGEIVDATIAADREQITSAIRNLLHNAIIYTASKDGGGTVSYRSWSEDGMVSIEVDDTGIGIPTRYIDRVFERFFRVDRARSRESGGTGLGLSIVRNVAVAHGGSIEVRSKVGVGSTFIMQLPIVQED